MSQAARGDTVRVHYTGKLEDGSVFDTSADRDPLEFTIGAGQTIAGFDEAVVGMETGDSKTTTVPADRAYGARREDMVVAVERERLPNKFQAAVGDRLQTRLDTGQVIEMTILELTDEQVVLDANHPLAGKDLTFDIQLIEVL